MNYQIYRYEELSPDQLYGILKLRQDVFMVEQQSIYEDIDGHDQSALHICIEKQGDLHGYLRLRLNLDDKYAKIERVVVAPTARRKGLARLLMDVAVKKVIKDTKLDRITLAAQITALGLYRDLGFIPFGNAFDDGGIAHQEMVWEREVNVKNMP